MRKRIRPETLEKYVTRAREKLIEVAGKGETITYKKLMNEMGGPGRGYIGQVLEEICQEEDRHGRPLLSALAVHTVDLMPGNGFWKLSVVRKHFSHSRASRKKKIDFWENERDKVYKHWASGEGEKV